MKFQGWNRCYYCGKPMDDKDIDNYSSKLRMCCDGHECSCMGMPIDPPWCLNCEEIFDCEE